MGGVIILTTTIDIVLRVPYALNCTVRPANDHTHSKYIIT